LASLVHIISLKSGQIHHPLSDVEESIETLDDLLPSGISKNLWIEADRKLFPEILRNGRERFPLHPAHPIVSVTTPRGDT
jgi:hypothetical protein